MTIDPALHPFIAALAKAFPEGLEAVPVAEMRTRMAALAGPAAPLPDGMTIEDLSAPRPDGTSVPIRLYRPRGAGPLPGLLYFHGGGWVMGSIQSHEPITAALAQDSGVAVLSVDYRLAPEHPFPAAFDDALTAWLWLADQATHLALDPARLAIGGDSAGGNLSAALALHLRGKSRQPCGQLLIYPAVDDYLDTASYHQNAAGPFLTRTLVQAFWRYYVGAAGSGGDLRATPMREPDLSGLPPAAILAAEHDPLRDEAIAYASKLRNAGGKVDLRLAVGMIHGFLRAVRISPAAAAEYAWLAASLRQLVANGA